MRLFADDCLVYQIVDRDEDRDRLQEDLDKLTSWAEDWQMRFNVSKCYSMHLTHPRKKPTLHTYSMNGTPLTTVEENPYLGITISCNMKWNTYINNTVAKGKHLLGFLRCNLRRCSPDLKAKAYKTLV